MKYRALLIVPNATRETKPEQSLGNVLSHLEDWAQKTLVKAPADSEVVIFETVEKPVARFTKNLTGEAVKV